MSSNKYNAVTPMLERRKRGKGSGTGGSGATDTNSGAGASTGASTGAGLSRDEVPKKKQKQATIPQTSTNQNSTTTPQSSTTPQRWPESLEQFVSRCVVNSNGLDGAGKLVCQQELRHLLDKAERENKLFINDWNAQQIPVLSSQSIPLQLVCDIVAPKTRKKKEPSKETSTPQKRNLEVSSKYDSEERKRQRMNRFSTPEPGDSGPNLPSKPSFATPGTNGSIANDSEHLKGQIVGRCQTIEKRYYRLTSEPDPALVRPENILRKAVKFLLGKLETKPYSYIKDQFKAIRQDMTVQHLRNDFCMYVYETNARISIENNDLGEMNQCLTQLEYLFDSKVERNTKLNCTELEFNCYRILYMLMVQNHSEIFKLKYKILKRSYTEADELNMLKYVNKSFDLQKAIISSNYYTFFKMMDEFKALPLAYKLIKDFIAEKERIKSLNIISKSYRKLPIDFLTEQLNIDSEGFDQFVDKFKLGGFISNNEFDCAGARAHMNNFMANTNFKRIDIKGQV